MVVLMRTAFATRQKGEPMSDLIDRQAAIDAMKDMYHAAEKWGKEASDDVTKARAESCMASLVEMKLCIEKLPSAQPLVIHCTDCEDWLERQSTLGFTISELPSVQPDIILCPNCRYNDGTAYCELHYRDVKAKDFCSWAERRTDG